MENKFFKYTNEDLEQLKEKDQKLCELINKIGYIKREINPNVFNELIRSIVAQQISTKAAITVTKNLKENVGLYPKNLCTANIMDIKNCGMSIKKAENIKMIATAYINKTVLIDDYNSMSDMEIIEDLVKLRGVGEWTAEMLMLFSLNRMDILSYNDLIIKKSICRLYGYEKISKKEFTKFKKLYSPFGSIAALYLWEYNKY